MHGPLNRQLNEARIAAGLTQSQIAAKIGWKTHSQVAHVEKGTRDTDLSAAQAWARACGYEIALIPVEPADAEGLGELVKTVRDPMAREVIAQLIRLVRFPHRYWIHFLEDFRHEARRAERDAGRYDGLAKESDSSG